ncbi:MAG: hypothetical protein OWU84_10270 [Firmicutes bacterium]|nr:hypothetical protein [Bacillota bacterium]
MCFPSPENAYATDVLGLREHHRWRYQSPLAADPHRARAMAQHYMAYHRAFSDATAAEPFARQSRIVEGRMVSEARMLELFHGAGFRDVRQFYLGLYYGGWIMHRTSEAPPNGV